MSGGRYHLQTAITPFALLTYIYKGTSSIEGITYFVYVNIRTQGFQEAKGQGCFPECGGRYHSSACSFSKAKRTSAAVFFKSNFLSRLVRCFSTVRGLI